MTPSTSTLKLLNEKIISRKKEVIDMGMYYFLIIDKNIRKECY